MQRLKVFCVLVSITLFGSPFSGVFAQNNKYTPEQLEGYEKQVEQMVKFLEYTLNTIGDEEVPASEKDIIINQSYSKFFRDDKVQVEDDLDETREVVTNKDVQAYLKDIDFFFHHVAFKLDIDEIESFFNDRDQLFFKVSLNRTLQGTSITGDSVNNTHERYLEINFNDAERDFKIVSFYTTKLSEKEEIAQWWNQLSLPWREIVAPEIEVNDSLNLDSLLLEKGLLVQVGEEVVLEGVSYSLEQDWFYDGVKKWWGKTELDLSVKTIETVEPVAKLRNLKTIDISRTMVSDVSPLRNLSKLEVLKLNESMVQDLSSLKHTISLKELYCEGTNISEISAVANFTQLNKFSCAFTPVSSLAGLEELKTLKVLNISNTPVESLAQLKNLNSLEFLDISHSAVLNLHDILGLDSLISIDLRSTQINNVEPLKGMLQLKMVLMDNSNVTSLKPLEVVPSLSTVYCDNTKIGDKEIITFIDRHPKVLVVYRSEYLQNWWAALSVDWKSFFEKNYKIPAQPSKEELQQLATVTSIDLSGKPIVDISPLQVFASLKVLNLSKTQIRNLNPLKKLANLRDLNISETSIHSLEALSSMGNLEKIDVSACQIASLEGIGSLKELKVIKANNTSLESLAALKGNTSLEQVEIEGTSVGTLKELTAFSKISLVYADRSQVDDKAVNELLDKRPDCLVVYKTATLKEASLKLSDAWKKVLSEYLKIGSKATKEQLHQVVRLEKLDISGVKELKSFDILSLFTRLKFLNASNTNFSNLAVIRNLSYLEELFITDTQVSDITPVASLSNLKVLDFSRTPVSSVTPVAQLKNVRSVSFENTPVENISSLASLPSLEELKFSGARVSDLKPLGGVNTLKVIECYNTSVKHLKYIHGLPHLEELKCYNTRLNQKKVDKFKAATPKTNVVFY